MELRSNYITGFYTAAFDLNWKDQTIIEDTHEAFFEKRKLIIETNNPLLFLSSEFEWGCRSKGTTQLARSILLELTDQSEAIRYADDLVHECLALIPSKRDFQIQIFAVRKWLNAKRGATDSFDLLFWTKIEEPSYRKPPPSINEAMNTKVTVPAPIEPTNPVLSKNDAKRLEAQKGESRMNEKPKKYPFGELEVGGYFYFINPDPKEMQVMSSTQASVSKKDNKKFKRRIVTADWAREHGINVAQDSATVCVVLREQ